MVKPVDLRIVPKTVYVLPREVVRLGERWIIYLPQGFSRVWEEIKRQGKKVEVYLVVVD